MVDIDLVRRAFGTHFETINTYNILLFIHYICEDYFNNQILKQDLNMSKLIDRLSSKIRIREVRLGPRFGSGRHCGQLGGPPCMSFKLHAELSG